MPCFVPITLEAELILDKVVRKAPLSLEQVTFFSIQCRRRRVGAVNTSRWRRIHMSVEEERGCLPLASQYASHLTEIHVANVSNYFLLFDISLGGLGKVKVIG